MAVRRKKEGRLAPAEKPVVVLLDRKGPNQLPAAAESGAPSSAVYVAIVRDVGKLVDERSLGAHADVIDALVDLVIELMENEGSDGTGSPGR